MASQKYAIKAYYVAKSLPLAEIEKKNELALLTKRRNSLVFQPAHDRIMVVFSFGVVVLFNFDDKLAQKFVKQVSKYGIEPTEKHKTEEYDVVIDPEKKPGVEFDFVTLNRIDTEQIHLVAEVLAQSVAIEYVEERVEHFMGRFERIYTDLEKDGRIRVSDLEVRKMIGGGRNVVQYVITQLSLLDKPETTWNDKDIESLFVGMRKMFELEDRFRNIEFRLNFIQDTSELVLDILAHKRSYNLEVAVLWLFIIDVALIAYEIFSRR